MKAVILAGGQGTRLRPLTYSVPKQLVPIAGRPVLAHIVANLEECGVEDIAIVTSPEAEAAVRQMISDEGLERLGIEVLIQNSPDGLAAAYEVALDWVADEPCVLYLGDCLLTGGIGHVISEHVAGDFDATILVAEVDDPSRYGIVEVADSGLIERLVEKPTEPKSNLAIVGVYVFGSGTSDIVRAVEPGFRGEREITDALQAIVDGGGRVAESRLAGWWIDTGTPPDVLNAQALLLEGLETSQDGTLEGSDVTGSVFVAEGASVEGAVLVGPVVLAEGAVVRGGTVGPNVSVGRGCVVESSTIHNSIVMSGSIVSTSHLSDSIVGPDSEIRGVQGQPDVRLIVGAESAIVSGESSHSG